MAKAGGKRNRKGHPKHLDSEAHEIEDLDAAILAGAPPAGSSAVSAFDRTPPGQSYIRTPPGQSYMTFSALCAGHRCMLDALCCTVESFCRSEWPRALEVLSVSQWQQKISCINPHRGGPSDRGGGGGGGRRRLRRGPHLCRAAAVGRHPRRPGWLRLHRPHRHPARRDPPRAGGPRRPGRSQDRLRQDAGLPGAGETLPADKYTTAAAAVGCLKHYHCSTGSAAQCSERCCRPGV